MGERSDQESPQQADDHGRAGDRDMWVRLRVFVAQRPALRPAVAPSDDDTLRTAREWIVLTVRDVREFAEALHTGTCTGRPAVAGSSRAIAVSVVRMCQAFARNWANGARVTPTQVIQFNRDVELLRGMLDMLASQSAPESAPLPAPSTSARRRAGTLRSR